MRFYKKPEFFFFIHTAIAFLLFFLFYISLFSPQIDSYNLFNISIVLVVLSLALNFIFLSLKNKSIKYYKKIVTKLENIQDGTDIEHLEKLTFPEEDELGNLGSVLNTLTRNIIEFDTVKRDKINLFRKEVTFLINLNDKPLVISDDKGIIQLANSAFSILLEKNIEEIIGKNFLSFLEFDYNELPLNNKFRNKNNQIELVNLFKNAFKNKSEDFFQQFSNIMLNKKYYHSLQIGGFKQASGNFIEYCIIIYLAQ